VKGLDLLCRAWAELPPEEPALLLVAGSGDGPSEAALRRWLTEQPGPPAVYLGPVTGERKLALLSSAWLLALPSYSENYGMVVAEALASGTPVLTTTSMPWAEVRDANCGWSVPAQADAVGQALREALRLTPEDHESMRARARALVLRSHSLQNAVARMERCYEEVIGGRAVASERPA